MDNLDDMDLMDTLGLILQVLKSSLKDLCKS